MADITTLLNSAAPGSAPANELFELLYGELKSLARQQARRHGSADVHTTTLVHEAYLKFQGVGALRLEDRRHFLAYATRVMRSIIVDHARQRLAIKRGEGGVPVTLDTNVSDSRTTDAEVIEVDEALAKLADLDARLGQIVELKYFGDMSHDEIADVLQVSLRTVQRGWEKARLFLSASLRRHGALS
jgi:RNA polymerase sigma factor (TIGR02999 family)